MDILLSSIAIALAVGGLILGFVILRKLGTDRAAGLEQALRQESRSGREESARAARDLREEVARSIALTSDNLIRVMDHLSTAQRAQLDQFADRLQEAEKTSRENAEGLRAVLLGSLREQRTEMEGALDKVRTAVEARLEEIRKTVDEQLHGTLEKRLGESFQLVSGNLEKVHQGLGEMRVLAEGVGDLKKVLSNVKIRGTWAEVQLGAILEQILTPEQFAKNVKVRRDSDDHVEFAVRLPGREEGAPVWLPIDSKFPQEAYLRLLDATDAVSPEGEQAAVGELIRAVKLSARTIQQKYIAPPDTTDFAVLFLPTEGLYGEVLRQPGLLENLQETCRVVVAGPTTLSALLNSLRMGFRTLAIEQQAGEVWRVLGAVKTEFGRFGEVLDKVKRQLHTASRTLDKTGVRTRAMERKLRAVEELPLDDAARLLGVEEEDGGEGGVQ